MDTPGVKVHINNSFLACQPVSLPSSACQLHSLIACYSAKHTHGGLHNLHIR